MTSEIRANTLKNRVGLGTIEYSNTGPVISGVTTSNNFKTGSTNVHSVGIEAAGINVLGADTPIGTGATIYNSGAAVFTGEVTATSFSGIVKATNLTSDRVVFTTTNGQLEASGNLTYNGTTFANASTTYFDNQVYWRNSGTNKMFTLSNNSGMNWQDDVKAEFGNSGDLKIYNVSNENHIYGSTSQPIIFSTNTDERLRITSSGQVRIGSQAGTDTTSHAIQLSGAVNNDSILSLYNPTSNQFESVRQGFFFKNSNNNATEFARIESTAMDTTAATVKGDLRFYTTNGANSPHMGEKVRITSSGYIHAGNLGHGNNKVGGQEITGQDYDPYFKLYASTANHWLMQLRSDSTSGNGIFLRSGNSSSTYTLYATGYDESNPHLVVRGDGKIGIATNTGSGLINTRHAGTNQQVLSVRADLGSSNGRSLNLFTPDTDNSTAPFRFQTGNGYLFQCDNENVFTIAHNRKVGINSTAPSNTLVVREETDNNPSIQLFRPSTGGDIANIIWATNQGNQASINYRGGGGNIGMQFYTGGTASSNERFRISDGLVTLFDSTAAYHKPTLKIANQYHGRYGGSIVFTAEDNAGTEFTTGRIRAYGGTSNTGGQIGVGCGDFLGDGDKIRIYKDGKIAISPTGNCTSYTDSLAVTIIQNGGTNGYPGLHIKSTHGGGDEGMSLVATDDNWDLYTLSGNENGLGILRAGSASSSNARFYLTQSGHLTVGDHAYTDLATSKKGHTMMHVAGGGLSVGPKGNHAQSTEGGRYVLGWYMTGYSSSQTYLHLITDLWAGGSPHGNSEYIMGGFHVHGHQYSGGASVSRERIYFHNWSGGYPGYSNSNGGNWAPGNTVYTHSTGYVTLRLLTGSYRGYIIDLIQHAWYPTRDINVTSATYSNSSTL